jgi:hypothetical protein
MRKATQSSGNFLGIIAALIVLTIGVAVTILTGVLSQERWCGRCGLAIVFSGRYYSRPHAWRRIGRPGTYRSR